MTIQKLLNQLEIFDELLKMKNTGTPEEFANKLGMSRRQFFRFKNELKIHGILIEYSKVDKTYKYVGKTVSELVVGVE